MRKSKVTGVFLTIFVGLAVCALIIHVWDGVRSQREWDDLVEHKGCEVFTYCWQGGTETRGELCRTPDGKVYRKR